MFDKLAREINAINLEDPAIQQLTTKLELEAVSDDDEVVGQLDDEAVKLFIYSAQLRQQLIDSQKEYLRLHLRMEDQHDDAACHAYNEQMNRLATRLKLINPLFWNMVRLELDLIECERLVLRQGWKIVKQKQEQEHDTHIHMVEIVGGSGAEDLFEMLGLNRQMRPRRRWPFGRD